ncbi:hypothetical protein GCM10011610_49970 [Nocardia rhizosphaerihabitans]|uniref:Tyr recombinase domain-containing protein n=2 Tax=Nocardia rhizosphaerihabitans TaxID=1691570 RepID=A0ABQ2KS06_9NOCA|nr:hypothetical protein GCM10011610_49970 [Nocardia rhizosphaerihabitans]
MAAARLLLAQMGITGADLVDTAPAAPTFAEVIPRVRARLSAGTARTYGTHFDLLESRWPDRSLTEPTRHELEELDALILRFHLETACRRGGALALRPQDLDRDQCLVFLREKGGSDRWQPVSPTLMRHLNDHATDRGAPFSGQLLRYRHGRPITTRRYDYIWGRISESLPWVATQGVTAHWLRHTTLTWVERTFSYAVARAFAGHRGKSSGTTDTYVKSHLQEVAAALAVLTGEPHPLARGVGHPAATPTRDLRLTEFDLPTA